MLQFKPVPCKVTSQIAPGRPHLLQTDLLVLTLIHSGVLRG